MKFSEMLEDVVAQKTQTTVANTIGMDQSKLCRFRQKEGAITLENIEQLMALADARVITKRQEENMMITIETLAELFRGARSG